MKIILSITTILIAVYLANKIVDFLLIDKTLGLMFALITLISLSSVTLLLTSNEERLSK